MSVSANIWALIPIKARGQGKSRLAVTLSDAERDALVDAMLRHVVDAAADAKTVARTVLVGPSRHGMDAGIPLIDEPGSGLNDALAKALDEISNARGRPDRLIVIAADLPCVTALDLDLLAEAPHGTIAIAPDRHGTGTNALCLPLPEAAGFRFHYGTDSAARHREEAERLGLSVETILSEGLEKDIDEPSDLVDAGQVYTIKH
ncbi:2-phospho-L-lactate guanylyltransferase [Novosphingobium mangrovi (ex Huang et al. 2023)]|uniref:3-phospho-D-glycerate guanylyltransferase n=1 Tax=Novosphingobium mangrovi (ex Huang et al. 2023) TaxID=2976432 RepID=A0ABT2I8C8_9SPHN|nr:2-phospho-L-lactate guanylyltransferase [Novosphingobium mangrovi (ex Huang et al. 2023)]MCT2401046.1 2-phospho-L-lactate guanylyltransferase [Novosphingobium mangrovi (ex Huang et al. 2023)]